MSFFSPSFGLFMLLVARVLIAHVFAFAASGYWSLAKTFAHILSLLLSFSLSGSLSFPLKLAHTIMTAASIVFVWDGLLCIGQWWERCQLLSPSWLCIWLSLTLTCSLSLLLSPSLSPALGPALQALSEACSIQPFAPAINIHHPTSIWVQPKT